MLALVLALVASPRQQLPAASVPAVVRHAWESKYTGNNAVTWHLAGDGNYDGEFSVKAVHTIARYTPNGTWIETRRETGAIHLPDPVRTSLVRDLRGLQISDAWSIELPGGAHEYQVDAAGPGGHKVMRYAANGDAVRKKGGE